MRTLPPTVASTKKKRTMGKKNKRLISTKIKRTGGQGGEQNWAAGTDKCSPRQYHERRGGKRYPLFQKPKEEGEGGKKKRGQGGNTTGLATGCRAKNKKVSSRNDPRVLHQQEKRGDAKPLKTSKALKSRMSFVLDSRPRAARVRKGKTGKGGEPA